ncbi:unnamed protein product, partial [Prorocentrum cordatum]
RSCRRAGAGRCGRSAAGASAWRQRRWRCWRFDRCCRRAPVLRPPGSRHAARARRLRSPGRGWMRPAGARRAAPGARRGLGRRDAVASRVRGGRRRLGLPHPLLAVAALPRPPARGAAGLRGAPLVGARRLGPHRPRHAPESTDLGRTWSAARALFSAADLGAPGEVLTVGNPTAVFAEDASGGPGRAVLLFTAQFGGDSEASIWARTSRGSRWPFVTESFDGGERGAGRATSRRARRGPRGPGTPRARARRPAPPRRARRAAPRAVRPRDGGRGRLRAAALTPHLQRRPGRHLAPGGGGAAWHQRVRCGGARQRHRAAQQPRLARGRQPAGAERVGRRRRDVHGAGGQAPVPQRAEAARLPGRHGGARATARPRQGALLLQPVRAHAERSAGEGEPVRGRGLGARGPPPRRALRVLGPGRGRAGGRGSRGGAAPTGDGRRQRLRAYRPRGHPPGVATAAHCRLTPPASSPARARTP